jgi:hypothetical protein
MPANVQSDVQSHPQVLQQAATILQHPRNVQATAADLGVSTSVATKGTVATEVREISYPLSMAAVADLISHDLGFACNVNTLKSRWLPDKILPCYKGLKCPPLKDQDGKITEFGYTEIRNFIARCIAGESGQKTAPESYREELEQRFEAVRETDPHEALRVMQGRISTLNSQATEEISALVKIDQDSEAIGRLANDTTQSLAELRRIRTERDQQRKAARRARLKDQIRQELLEEELLREELEEEIRQELERGK